MSTSTASLDTARLARPALPVTLLTLLLVAAGPGTAQQTSSCALRETAWRSVSHSARHDRHRIELSRPGCEVDVRIEGAIAFTPDLRSIDRLSRDAILRIRERDGRTERTLEVRPGPDGRPRYELRVDRDERAFDDDARAWLSGMLVQLFRGAGFAADQRVAMILDDEGVDGVIRELDLIPSDHVRSVYLRELLRARRLEPDRLRAIVRREAERTDSDHYLAEALRAVADQPGSAAITADIAAAARAFDSDHYRSELLGHLRPADLAEPRVREAFLDAVDRMDSDHYRSETLRALIDVDRLSTPVLARLIRTARMDSDHYTAETLIRIARRHIITGAARAAYLEVMDGMDSDTYRGRVAEALLRQERALDWI